MRLTLPDRFAKLGEADDYNNVWKNRQDFGKFTDNWNKSLGANKLGTLKYVVNEFNYMLLPIPGNTNLEEIDGHVFKIFDDNGINPIKNTLDMDQSSKSNIVWSSISRFAPVALCIISR